MRKEFSAKVKAAALARADGKCEGDGCGAVLAVAKYAFDHVIPDGLTGEPTLDNCRVLCLVCHGIKTKKDVADIAKAKRRERKHLGIRKPATMPGSKNSKWKKKINRPTEFRDGADG